MGRLKIKQFDSFSRQTKDSRDARACHRRAVYNEISSWAGGGQEEASPGERASGARRASVGKPQGRSPGTGLGTGLCGPTRAPGLGRGARSSPGAAAAPRPAAPCPRAGGALSSAGPPPARGRRRSGGHASLSERAPVIGGQPNGFAAAAVQKEQGQSPAGPRGPAAAQGGGRGRREAAATAGGEGKEKPPAGARRSGSALLLKLRSQKHLTARRHLLRGSPDCIRLRAEPPGPPPGATRAPGSCNNPPVTGAAPGCQSRGPAAHGARGPGR